MAILWCGGEDIDFAQGQAVTVDMTTTYFRSAWSRCAIENQNSGAGMAKSLPFAGGSITSCWFSLQYATRTAATSKVGPGLGKSGSNSGLFIGTDSASSSKLALWKYDGSTFTNLAQEAGNSLGTNTLVRIDMQLVSYGASATVNVYLNGVLVITFTGDVTVSGVTDLDSVFFASNGASNVTGMSEVIVADEDTRAFPGLKTLALTGAGTTNSWTNSTFSNINGTSFSDANPTYSNANAQENQYNVTDLPSGTFAIKANKLTARACKSSSPSVTKIQFGYNNAGTVGFGAAAVAMTTAYATYEQLDNTDPTNSGAPWTQSEMNGLQLEMKSAT